MSAAWFDRAECRGLDPAIFYPERGENEKADKARTICHGCPAQTDCLHHAIYECERTGIWGGCTETERRTVQRRLRLPTRNPAPQRGTAA